MARNPARIMRLAVKFSRLWTKIPDMRFFQLIDLIKQSLPEEQAGIRHGIIDGVAQDIRDPYHIEDDVVERCIDSLIIQVQN